MTKKYPEKKLLNLGCGHRFRSDWVNVDFNPHSKEILGYNLTQRLPFQDNSFDLIYHSHFLEHLSQSQGESFMLECHRLLKPDGVVRVVVPDLENIVIAYLEVLAKAKVSDDLECKDLEWMHIELYDQLVREQPDGAFKSFFFEKEIQNSEFLISRMGACARQILDYRTKHIDHFSPAQIYRKKISVVKNMFRPLLQILKNPDSLRNLFIKLLLGKEYQYYEIGRFRSHGETHKCMYDIYALSALLKKLGFVNITRVDAATSLSPYWQAEGLDLENGEIYHPSSLFIEAKKATILTSL